MNQAVSDSRDYFNQRLHDRNRQRIRWGDPERVTRRVCMSIDAGATEAIPGADSSVKVCCASGSLWITHDSDPKDIVLGPRQSYRSEREDTMRMHALAPCVVEVEFEDEVVS